MSDQNRAENPSANHGVSRRPSTDDEGQPSKKRGRRRLNCAECRRLKLKCNLPCDNCLKRNCVSICPEGARQGTTRKLQPVTSGSAQDVSYWQRRTMQLETLLNERGIPSDQLSSDVREAEQPQTTISPRPESLQTELDLRGRSAPALADQTVDAQPDYIPDAGPPVFAASDPHSVHFRYDLNSTPQSAHNPTSSSSAPLEQRVPVSPHSQHGHGTLVIGESGGSRWLGPSAGTEWLRNQERAGVSRAPSDDGEEAAGLSPLGVASTRLSTSELYARLPLEDEGRALVDSYRRFFAWNHDPISRPALERLLLQAYSTQSSITRIHIHQLAVLYAVFAIGALLSLEYQPNDPVADEYLVLAQVCLTKGNFTVHNTIAGVQAVNLVAHYHSESEKGRNGDLAWPLWGLAMKLIQGMGVHRDGTRWNLSQEVVEERRQLFWECHTIDVFQAHCFSRPVTMQAKHIDTMFPAQDLKTLGGERDFKRMKYMLAELFEAALDQAMTVQPPEYEHVVKLYDQLCTFERSIPLNLRCRAALQATPSRYPIRDEALRDSPEMDRRNLKRTFEQFTLALNVSEAILFLHRPYYIKTLHESPEDPTRSRYGQSFLAVVERCNVTTQIVCGIADAFPRVAARHWFYWYHLFTAAVCIGVVPLRCAQSPLSPFALNIISQAIRAYSIAVAENPSPSLVRNHKWLISLQQKASHKVMALSLSGLLPASRSSEAEEDDAGMLGWTTRLIERGAQMGVRQTVIRQPGGGGESGGGALEDLSTSLRHAPSTLEPEVGASHDSFWQSQSDSGDMNQLNQFWDPLLFPDPLSNQPGGLASVNWWAWDGCEATVGEPGPGLNQI